MQQVAKNFNTESICHFQKEIERKSISYLIGMANDRGLSFTAML